MIKFFSFFSIAAVTVFFSACDSNRVYEDYKEFNSRKWLLSDSAVFEFQITDTSKKYNLLFNVRNSIDYPYSRLFVNYKLSSADKKVISAKMFSGYLFDQKTGKPFGSSGIGDIYDNQILLLRNYSFHQAGNYRVRFEQFMRMDTLPGILAAGLRVEEALAEKK